MKSICALVLFVSAALGARQIIETIPSNDDVIEGEYLVGLNTGLVHSRANEQALIQTFEAMGIDTVKLWTIGSVKIMYVKGDEAALTIVGKLSEVRYVEPNGYAYIAQCAEGSAAGCWGLDRIDQRGQLTYSEPESPGAVYTWGDSDGENVNAYIGDTGIDISHPDFGGRATFGYTAVGIENPGEDNNGHGTHCAGTIGSASYGVAKSSNLIAVKQLNDNGGGPWSAYLDAIDWITAQHIAGGLNTRSVISLSLSGSCCNQGVEDSTNAAIDAGVVVVAAAGNSDREACLETPANIPRVITVGASDVGDMTATFSNYGSCVDVYAPGVDVLSTYLSGGTTTLSGTSMACPHTAGLVSRYLSSTPAPPTPDQVSTWIRSESTQGALTFRPGQTADNMLIYGGCPL